MTDTLIMVVGQSNALGYGVTSPAPYVPTGRVEIWTGTEFNYMNPGVNTGTPANPTSWGPEVEFANRWLADNPTGTLYIGKVVKGSTSLAVDWAPSHAPGGLFDQATTVANQMQANLAHPGLDGVLWMQGEADATNDAQAASYEANLTQFIADARAAWHDDAFTFGRINDGVGLPDDNLAVRVAQFDVDYLDPMASSFKTIGFDMQADDLHYSAVGQVQLGAGFYDGWVGL